jgi:hypothetical protein
MYGARFDGSDRLKIRTAGCCFQSAMTDNACSKPHLPGMSAGDHFLLNQSTTHPTPPIMKPTTILLLPILAISLSSCIVEVPNSNQSQSATSPSSSYQSGNPRIETNPNGTIRATFPGDSRYALFDRNGNLIEGGPNCNDEDLFRAKQAVRSYLGR